MEFIFRVRPRFSTLGFFLPPAFRLPISCRTPIRKTHRFPAQEKNHFVSFRPRGREKVAVVKSKNSSNFPLPSSLSGSHFPSSPAAHILQRLIFLLDLLLLDLLLPRRFLRVFFQIHGEGYFLLQIESCLPPLQRTSREKGVSPDPFLSIPLPLDPFARKSRFAPLS